MTDFRTVAAATIDMYQAIRIVRIAAESMTLVNSGS